MDKPNKVTDFSRQKQEQNPPPPLPQVLHVPQPMVLEEPLFENRQPSPNSVPCEGVATIVPLKRQAQVARRGCPLAAPVVNRSGNNRVVNGPGEVPRNGGNFARHTRVGRPRSCSEPIPSLNPHYSTRRRNVQVPVVREMANAQKDQVQLEVVDNLVDLSPLNLDFIDLMLDNQDLFREYQMN